MKFYRRWELVGEGYREARNKDHGAGGDTRYNSLVLGLMRRAIALRLPMGWALFLVWGWRLRAAILMAQWRGLINGRRTRTS